jgi:multiple sugar transport system ATP-binding protein
MATVRFEGATRTFAGSSVPAVNSLDLDIGDGEFMVLVGPSGSGKSTALRMLAGLELLDEGSVFIGDRDVTEYAPKDRDVAMVFQNYALYPQMTVAENIGFSLKVRRRSKDEVRASVQRAAEILGLENYLDRKPGSLSGGQRQRVAMGRAIVREPQVFLMDEPLSNLDAQLRVATRTEISSLQRRLGITTVYVTHDQVEAMTMGDRVAVLKDGLLQQCDTSRTLYDLPANLFIAGFIGSPAMNLVEADVDERGVHVGSFVMPISASERAKVGNRATLGLRPSALEIVTVHEGIPATVDVVEELGDESFVYATVELGETTKKFTIKIASGMSPTRGETIGFKPLPDSYHLFNPIDGLRITS